MFFERDRSVDVAADSGEKMFLKSRSQDFCKLVRLNMKPFIHCRLKPDTKDHHTDSNWVVWVNFSTNLQFHSAF